jgi:26S proteasome regulatory subunit T1
LTEQDIALIKRYGKGPYWESIRLVEADIKTFNQKISSMCGIKESDTGLALPAQWNLQQDQELAKQHPLQVGRCTKIINKGSENAKYVVSHKHHGRFVVGLDKELAPTDVEENMRVGTQRVHEIGSKIAIKLPLPPKIDPSVTMMQVEEKPDVTYSDLGGCKEQIEKIREVVELPLLHPEKFATLGIDPPKGVLLYGPPGTGKTLTARAVANRTDATFIRVIGSELVQRYVGEGARLVREIF